MTLAFLICGIKFFFPHRKIVCVRACMCAYVCVCVRTCVHVCVYPIQSVLLQEIKVYLMIE